MLTAANRAALASLQYIYKHFKLTAYTSLKAVSHTEVSSETQHEA